MANTATGTTNSLQSSQRGVGRSARPAGAYVLMGLLLLLAFGALYGGGALILDPSGGILDMPVSLLAGSAFTNYLVPGLILFALFGLASLLLVVGLWLEPSWAFVRPLGAHGAWLGTILVGGALIVWILVQMRILSFFLQPILLAQGAAIIVVALWPAVRRHFQEAPV